MKVGDLITGNQVFLDLEAECPKAVFRLVSDRIAASANIPAKPVLNALLERERLGSTALGRGISIPHARLSEIKKPQAYFIRLKQPIEMDAPDDELVDLMFVLLVPEGAHAEHLRVLSRVAKLLRSDDNQQRIRDALSPADVLSILTSAD